MEEVRGRGRGSYIFGRSVHNIRIERLWVDWTTGVGKKWYTFFNQLELSYGLCSDNLAHLWLLHHLFLATLNQDAVEWAEAWNSHKLTMEGQKKQTPREMFTFGLLEQGPRGIGGLVHTQEEAVGEYAQFGVDWEAHGLAALVNHVAQNNPQDWDAGNPFTTYSTPTHMSEVIVEPPNCPFTPEQVARLDAELMQVVDVSSRDMSVRKQVWQEALVVCRRLYEQ
ncbi:hypothetical protein B0H12DRAFT_1012203 [Mycena haematopus]|nr:hypothetical protein B0H12DRAFT_1012203 [Mycena haematopus]